MDFALSKVGKREEMDIPEEGMRLPHVKIIDISNQDQRDESFLSKERIRLNLPIPWKARSENRYRFTKWKYLQGQ